jgi:hypothetical protein
LVSTESSQGDIAKGLEPLVYKRRALRPASSITSKPICAAYPALIAVRLWRELKECGFAGGYSVVRDRVRELRPSWPAGNARRNQSVDLFGACRPADPANPRTQHLI